ncbi:hypothetical protein [Streptomyces sp. C36]|uniref:hypothetical protein n=1 Tax=Streptomyces sp. C36 TaxID=3237122 RepID=UPI0034C5CD59
MEDRQPTPGEKTSNRFTEASPTTVAKTLIAQASFVAALLFYLGALYTSQYYGYFHLSLFALGLGFADLVMRSTVVLRTPVMAVFVVVLIVAGLPRRPTGSPLPDRFARSWSAVGDTLARFHLVVVAAGLVLLINFRRVGPYIWVIPLVIAIGLLMGQTRDAQGNRPQGLRRRTLPALAAGLCLFWSLSLVTVQLGVRDAERDARRITERTGVLILSGKRLSLPSPTREEDLGAGLRHRYRYSNLRLVVEGRDGYYVVPVHWDHTTDPVYVIPHSEDAWVGLAPGVRPA